MVRDAVLHLLFFYLCPVSNENIMKKIKILSLFVGLLAILSACGDDDDEKRGEQLRTVLVYIAGDNSLRSFATEDMAEMTEGMQYVNDKSYNLLVYIDNGSNPKLVRLKRDKKGNVVQDVIAAYEGRNLRGEKRCVSKFGRSENI